MYICLVLVSSELNTARQICLSITEQRETISYLYLPVMQPRRLFAFFAEKEHCWSESTQLRWFPRKHTALPPSCCPVGIPYLCAFTHLGGSSTTTTFCRSQHLSCPYHTKLSSCQPNQLPSSTDCGSSYPSCYSSFKAPSPGWPACENHAFTSLDEVDSMSS